MSDLSQLDLIIKQGCRAPGPLNSCQLQYKHVLMRNILILFKTAFFFDRKLFHWQIFMQLHYLICLPSSHTCMLQNYFRKIIMLHVHSALDLLLPGHLSSLGVRDSKEESHQNKGD